MNKKSLKLLFVIIFLSMGLLSAEARRKPVIGIAPGYSGANSSIVNRSYTDAVYRAGGIPVILPQVNDEAAAAESSPGWTVYCSPVVSISTLSITARLCSTIPSRSTATGIPWM